jgi:uracil-DNA glycosylase
MDGTLHFIIAINFIKVEIIVVLFARIMETLHLLPRNTTPVTNVRTSREKNRSTQEIIPVLPSPATMILNFNPGSETELALEDFDIFLLANTIFAFGAVVAGDLCRHVRSNNLA